jgi:hypothetical protein
MEKLSGIGEAAMEACRSRPCGALTFRHPFRHCRAAGHHAQGQAAALRRKIVFAACEAKQVEVVILNQGEDTSFEQCLNV